MAGTPATQEDAMALAELSRTEYAADMAVLARRLPVPLQPGGHSLSQSQGRFSGRSEAAAGGAGS